jgi:phosphoserine aminotransferase
MARVYNFNPGPATLPLEVLEEAQREFLDYKGSGMSVLESSHRGAEYTEIHEEAIANYKELLNCSDDYTVLFIAGGASLQFAMIPLNFLDKNSTADYVNTGSWASKAIKEAELIGNVNIAADTSSESPARIPQMSELNLKQDSAYTHITSNETIAGVQWKQFPETKNPLIGDMSSDILSRPFDINQFSMIYAGAQKNLGPSGIAIIVIRKDIIEKVNKTLPSLLKYETFIKKNSLFNTPPAFSIYIMMLVSRWIKKQGLSSLYEKNSKKAKLLYDVIDNSNFYKGTAQKESRSDMNVTFRLPNEQLDAEFIKKASEQGLKGLKGHRSVGGLRASIYNAFPVEGVEVLASFMKDFESSNS